MITRSRCLGLAASSVAGRPQVVALPAAMLAAIVHEPDAVHPFLQLTEDATHDAGRFGRRTRHRLGVDAGTLPGVAALHPARRLIFVKNAGGAGG